MNVGWVLSVADLRAKDKAFKTLLKSKEDASTKVEDLSKKYDAIEEGRFRVSLVAPHVEVDVDQRMRIKCNLTEEITCSSALSYLHQFNPFCYGLGDGSAFIEMDSVDLKSLEELPVEIVPV
jgi:hypothetical protein